MRRKIRIVLLAVMALFTTMSVSMAVLPSASTIVSSSSEGNLKNLLGTKEIVDYLTTNGTQTFTSGLGSSVGAAFTSNSTAVPTELTVSCITASNTQSQVIVKVDYEVTTTTGTTEYTVTPFIMSPSTDDSNLCMFMVKGVNFDSEYKKRTGKDVGSDSKDALEDMFKDFEDYDEANNHPNKEMSSDYNVTNCLWSDNADFKEWFDFAPRRGVFCHINSSINNDGPIGEYSSITRISNIKNFVEDKIEQNSGFWADFDTVEWTNENALGCDNSGKGIGCQLKISDSQVSTTSSNSATETISVRTGYLVEYNKNTTDSVTGMPAGTTKTAGQPLTLSNNKPVRGGYEFLYWNTKADGSGTKYTAGQSYTTDADVTLYAQWEVAQYTVVYNGNGKTSGAMANSVFGRDADVNLSKNQYIREFEITYNSNGGAAVGPQKATATFNGWATTATGAKVYNDQALVKNLAPKDGSITLYANWTDATVALLGTTRYNYSFAGWYDQNGNAVGGEGKLVKPTENMVLYAHWKNGPDSDPDPGSNSEYTITYVADSPNGSTVIGLPGKQVVLKGQDCNITTQRPETEDGNYKVEEWNTKSDYTGVRYTPNQVYTKQVDITLYGVWKGTDKNPDRYAITYVADRVDGSKVHDMPSPNPQEETNIPCNISGNKPWADNGEVVSAWSKTPDSNEIYLKPGDEYAEGKSIILYAIWGDVGSEFYTITYDSNGVEAEDMPGVQVGKKGESSQISSVMPKATGRSFENWNTMPNGEGQLYNRGAVYSADKDVILYAQWVPSPPSGEKGQVRYWANIEGLIDGEAWNPRIQIFVPGEKFRLLSDTPATGKGDYKFAGWNEAKTDSSEKLEYEPSQEVIFYQKVVDLYSRWMHMPEYSYIVRYYGNGSTGYAQEPANDNTVIKFDGGYLNTFVREELVKLTANKYERKFDLTLELNGGTLPSGMPQIKPSEFDGWAITTTGVRFYTNEQEGKNFAGDSSAIDLYARWIDQRVTLPKPEKLGYLLKYWKDDSGNIYQAGDIITLDGNKKLKAVWQQNIFPEPGNDGENDVDEQGNSAFKIISVRDLRWKKANIPIINDYIGKSSGLLLKTYPTGVDTIKFGYAVEFELRLVSPTVGSYQRVDVGFNTGTSINLLDNTIKKSYNVVQSGDEKRLVYRFVYYIPVSDVKKAGILENINLTDISAKIVNGDENKTLSYLEEAEFFKTGVPKQWKDSGKQLFKYTKLHTLLEDLTNNQAY